MALIGSGGRRSPLELPGATPRGLHLGVRARADFFHLQAAGEGGVVPCRPLGWTDRESGGRPGWADRRFWRSGEGKSVGFDHAAVGEELKALPLVEADGPLVLGGHIQSEGRRLAVLGEEPVEEGPAEPPALKGRVDVELLQ